MTLIPTNNCSETCGWGETLQFVDNCVLHNFWLNMVLQMVVWNVCNFHVTATLVFPELNKIMRLNTKINQNYRTCMLNVLKTKIAKKNLFRNIRKITFNKCVWYDCFLTVTFNQHGFQSWDVETMYVNNFWKSPFCFFGYNILQRRLCIVYMW